MTEENTTESSIVECNDISPFFKSNKKPSYNTQIGPVTKPK